MAASPSGAGSPTASSRVVAVASPRRISSANLARDPRTGKGKRSSSLFFRACLILTGHAFQWLPFQSFMRAWARNEMKAMAIVRKLSSFCSVQDFIHSFIPHSWAWWFRMWRVSSRPYRLKKTVICSRNVAIFIGKDNIVSQTIMPKTLFYAFVHGF